MDKAPHWKEEGSARDGMHAPAGRDEPCATPAPGTSDPRRLAEFAASWWAQLLPECQASWARRLCESLVPNGRLQILAYRRTLEDRRACELQLASYYCARQLSGTARVHEQQVREIDTLVALERNGTMRKADVAPGIAWWNGLTDGERAAWLVVSGGETVADAWAHRCSRPLSNLEVLEHLGRLITGARTTES
jgi:hypothetical protein